MPHSYHKLKNSQESAPEAVKNLAEKLWVIDDKKNKKETSTLSSPDAKIIGGTVGLTLIGLLVGLLCFFLIKNRNSNCDALSTDVYDDTEHTFFDDGVSPSGSAKVKFNEVLAFGRLNPNQTVTIALKNSSFTQWHTEVTISADDDLFRTGCTISVFDNGKQAKLVDCPTNYYISPHLIYGCSFILSSYINSAESLINTNKTYADTVIGNVRAAVPLFLRHSLFPLAQHLRRAQPIPNATATEEPALLINATP